MGKKHDKKKAEREAEIRRTEKKAEKGAADAAVADAAPPAVYAGGPVPEDEKSAARANADAASAALDAEIKARLQAKRAARAETPPEIVDSVGRIHTFSCICGRPFAVLNGRGLHLDDVRRRRERRRAR